jgi:hypothetical protein
MGAKIYANKEVMEARIDANNEKFEVLRGTLGLMDGYPPSQDNVYPRNKSQGGYTLRSRTPQYIPSGPS